MLIWDDTTGGDLRIVAKPDLLEKGAEGFYFPKEITLAPKAHADHILQAMVYVDLLEKIQDLEIPSFSLALGVDSWQSFSTTDYRDEYEDLLRELQQESQKWWSDESPEPLPRLKQLHGDYSSMAMQKRREALSLELIPDLTHEDEVRLQKRETTSLSGLARVDADDLVPAKTWHRWQLVADAASASSSSSSNFMVAGGSATAGGAVDERGLEVREPTADQVKLLRELSGVTAERTRRLLLQHDNDINRPANAAFAESPSLSGDGRDAKRQKREQPPEENEHYSDDWR